MPTNIHPHPLVFPSNTDFALLKEKLAEMKPRAELLAREEYSLTPLVYHLEDEDGLREMLIFIEPRRSHAINLIVEAISFTLTHLQSIQNEVKLVNSLDASLREFEEAGKALSAYLRTFDRASESYESLRISVDSINRMHESAYSNAKEFLPPLLASLRLAILEGNPSYPERIRNAESDVRGMITRISDHEKDAVQLVESLRNSNHRAALVEGIGTFAELGNHHEKFERSWFRGAVVLTAITSFFYYSAISGVVWNSPNAETKSTDAALKSTSNAVDVRLFGADILKKLLLLPLPLILLKIVLTKYNQERHLRILYGHRLAVLKQYQTFESSIKDESQRDAFRLEIAKYVFTDPQTGYLNKENAGEINFNPAISLVERVAKGTV